jgi:O-antigen/teichoic acid export membrane protein/SAM-dependent methyltransferase
MERELGEFGQGAQIRQAAQSAESGFADFPAAAHSGAALDVDERIRLMRDGLINYTGPLFSRIVGILLVPFMLRHLGAEAYGLWIASISVAAMVGLLDFGLGWSVMREVAGSGGNPDNATVRLVGAAANVYLVLGLAGAGIIAGAGFLLGGRMHLSPAMQAVAPAVFVLTGFAFVGDQMLTYMTEVLHGLRRFDLINAVSVGGSLLRATAIVAALTLGGRVTGVAACQLAVTSATAISAVTIVAMIEPRFGFRLGDFSLERVRAHLSFGIVSQLAHAMSQIVWSAPSLLVGVMLGSATIVPYYVGQRFPLAASEVGVSAGEVLMPAASEYDRARAPGTMRELLETGTRWILVLVLPICILLWIAAPGLLHAWLGEARPETVLILRLITAAVLLDSIGAAAGNVLWGRGSIGAILAVHGAVAVATLAISAWLLGRVGVVGAAWGLLIPVSLGSAALVAIASRVCAVSPLALATRVSRGLMFPAAACTAFVTAVAWSVSPQRWATLLPVAMAAGCVYAVALYRHGAREEEREMADAAIRSLRGVRDAADRTLRALLKRVWVARSAWHLVLALRDVVRYGPKAIERNLEAEFDARPDPWGYASTGEQRRMQSALALLDAALAGSRPNRCLEIGCAEGFFTLLLAPRCVSLLALDLSDLALARARERNRANRNAVFTRWNLLHDQLPEGQFELIVIMGVLEYVFRRKHLFRARDRLITLLAPGGYLLVSNSRTGEVSEKARWGRWLIRGGKWLSEFFAEHQALEKVSTFTGDFYVHTLLRKV